MYISTPTAAIAYQPLHMHHLIATHELHLSCSILYVPQQPPDSNAIERVHISPQISSLVTMPPYASLSLNNAPTPRPHTFCLVTTPHITSKLPLHGHRKNYQTVRPIRVQLFRLHLYRILAVHEHVIPLMLGPTPSRSDLVFFSRTGEFSS